MKAKIILTLSMVLCSTVVYGQYGPYDRGAWATYTPLTQQEILGPALMQRERHNRNAEKVDALIQYVLDLKRQTNDAEFLEFLDRQYHGLMKSYDSNLAGADDEIRQYRFRLQAQVDEHIRRINRQNMAR